MPQTCREIHQSVAIQPPSEAETGSVQLQHTMIHAFAVSFGIRNNSTNVSTMTVAAEMCGQ